LQSAHIRAATSEAVKPLGEGDRAVTASTTLRMRALLRSMPPTMVLPTREATGSCSEHVIGDETLIDASVSKSGLYQLLVEPERAEARGL
jgi:hypothetical protein